MPYREKIIFSAAFLFIVYFVGYALFDTPKITPEQKKTSAKRIISMSPSNTELLFAMGADEEIVGVTTYCDYPPQALTKEKIGSFYTPDIEKIISLRPDLVLANSTLQAEYIRQLRRANISVLPVNTEDIDKTLTSIDFIAQAIGREKEGALLIARLNSYRLEAKELLERYPSNKRVFIEVWDKPILTVGNKSYLNDLIKEAGGDNVAGQMDMDYFSWDIERIYVTNPDVYLRLRGVDMGSRADELPEKLKQLPAVKNGRVVTIFGDWIVRPGPRSIEALPQIIRELYGTPGN